MSVDINANTALSLLQGIVLLAGVVVIWKSQFNPSHRGGRDSRLEPWTVSGVGLLVIAFQAVIGGIIGIALASVLNSQLPSSITTDSTIALMVANSGFHLGVLAGILFGRRIPEFPPSDPVMPDDPLRFSAPLPAGKAITAGFLTYLAALPLVAAAMWLWQLGLDTAGIPRPKQELIDLFGRTHGFWKVTFMSTVAVVIAPITEELVFRAGIFRFVRTRMSRVLALTAPAALFALAHWNLSAFVPLMVLAIVLSLAYERTGRIVTSMVAHGLFNLTTILLLLAGLGG